MPALAPIRQFTDAKLKSIANAGMVYEQHRTKLTRRDFHRLLELGLVDPDVNDELVDGRIVLMDRMSPPRASCATRLTELLRIRVGTDWVVANRLPIALGDCSEVRPDVSIVAHRDDWYRENHPTPDDTAILIEVMDSTRTHRGWRPNLYARHSVRETWFVDLDMGIVEVQSSPDHGYYTIISARRPGDSLQSPTLASVALTVDEVLGTNCAE